MREIKKTFKAVAKKNEKMVIVETNDNRKTMKELVFKLIEKEYGLTFNPQTVLEIKKEVEKGNISFNEYEKIKYLIYTLSLKTNFYNHYTSVRASRLSGLVHTTTYLNGYTLELQYEEKEVEVEPKPITKEELAKMGYILVD
jgi:hypothetical protein